MNTLTASDFEHVNHCETQPEQRATYRGHTIQVYRDEQPQNPWTDWDCEPPLYVYAGQNYTAEYGIDLSVPELTRAEIKRNLSDINLTLESSSLLHATSAHREHHSDMPTLVNETLGDHAEMMLHVSDRMNFVAEVYAWKNIPALTATVNGYTQCDWAKLLLVATPEWCKKVGANITDADQLQSAVDLYESWAFGDVYGYIATDPNGTEIDSCWGFYGSELTASGLIESATDAIDYEIRHRGQAEN